MDNLTYEKHLISKAARSHTPINGSLELLPLCNMNCGMCYVRLSRPEMERQGHLHSAAEWISLARQMQKSGTLFLLLTGVFVGAPRRVVIQIAALHRVGERLAR